MRLQFANFFLKRSEPPSKRNDRESSVHDIEISVDIGWTDFDKSI